MLNNSSFLSLKGVDVNYCSILQSQVNNVAVHGIPALLIAVINALFSLVALTGNALILAAIWRNASLRIPSYIFLAGLAVTDFSTGLIIQPLYVAQMLNSNCIAITIFHASARYFGTVTMTTIAVLAIERWLYMSRRSCINARRAYVIYGVILLLPLPYIVARLWLLTSVQFTYIWEPRLLAIIGSSCFLATAFSYYKVFKLIRRHQRLIHASQSSQRLFQPSINLAKYKKSVYTILYIVGIFVLGYLPNVVLYSVYPILAASQNFKGNVNLNLAFHASLTLFYITSSLNPLLYCLRMKEIRDEVNSLILKILCIG